MSQPQDGNDLLMSGGVKSVKWSDHQIGYTVIGTVLDTPKAVQMTKYQSTELDFWPSGEAKMQVVVTLQTELRDPADATDDGRRRLFIEPRMMPPVREAVQRTGAKGLEVGGRLAVRWISGSGQGEGNARQFAAEYARPALDVNSMLGDNGHQAATPAQQAPMLGNAAPAAPTATQASMLATPELPPPPPNVDPEKWRNLPEAQRQAVLAAMAPAGAQPGY